MAVKYTRPRGTQDVLPADSGKWQKLEEKLKNIVGLYGYKEIRLPTFEHTEVFSRGVGDTTDIVGKEMYTFTDKGDRSITLRPEGTSGVVRAVLENGLLGSSPMPLKAFYLQSCFRYEKAQKGRLREFHQLGIECFGTNNPESDVEAICVADHILNDVGIKKYHLEINSIGCKTCRGEYHKALKEYFHQHTDCLCETCLDRLERNPMRILDCKADPCKEVSKNAPVVLDYLCEDCKEHFEKVKNMLTANAIDFKINPTIVRGLDYYSNTVFEFIHDGVGTQGTICGGGRYNGLVSEFEGQETAAVGFGMGIERLLLAAEDEGIVLPNTDKPLLYIVSLGDDAKGKAAQLAKMLRLKGIYVEFDIVGRGLKPQMKYADKIGAKYTVVIGDD
ncbi:MAG: histidine--tRNA ligase, partial [Oscillospiraceae bacterium]